MLSLWLQTNLITGCIGSPQSQCCIYEEKFDQLELTPKNESVTN